MLIKVSFRKRCLIKTAEWWIAEPGSPALGLTAEQAKDMLIQYVERILTESANKHQTKPQLLNSIEDVVYSGIYALYTVADERSFNLEDSEVFEFDLPLSEECGIEVVFHVQFG